MRFDIVRVREVAIVSEAPKGILEPRSSFPSTAGGAADGVLSKDQGAHPEHAWDILPCSPLSNLVFATFHSETRDISQPQKATYSQDELHLPNIWMNSRGRGGASSHGAARIRRMFEFRTTILMLIDAGLVMLDGANKPEAAQLSVGGGFAVKGVQSMFRKISSGDS